MKLNRNINIYGLTLFIMCFITTVSCSKDNIYNKQPTIKSIRITDPSLADSTFTEAKPGQMIVIQGNNLEKALAVYINDQMAEFNPNMNTSHSIIATIPSEIEGFILTAWDPDLKSEIRVVTRYGIATYAFKVLAPNPTITRIAGRYPRETGDSISIFGTNFLDITRVYFDNVNPLETDIKGEEINVTNYEILNNRYLNDTETSYITDSEMHFTLPNIPYQDGYIVIETIQGKVSFPYAALPPKPIISGISSDMPIPGSRVRIKGANFIDVESINIGNEIIISPDKIEVAKDECELSFIMPKKPSNTTKISVITPGGESNAIRFYCYETLLLDFDNLGKNMSWSPDAEYRTASSNAEPYVSDGVFGVYDILLTAYNYYGTMIYWQSAVGDNFNLAGYDIIPEDTPAENIYLLFECYNKYPFTKFFDYTIKKADGTDLNWNNRNPDTGTQIRPEFQSMLGDQPLGEWYTAVFPITTFKEFQGKTYKDIVESGVKRIRLMLKNQSGEAEQVFLCIDNVRISTLPTYNNPIK